MITWIMTFELSEEAREADKAIGGNLVCYTYFFYIDTFGHGAGVELADGLFAELTAVRDLDYNQLRQFLLAFRRPGWELERLEQ